MYETKYMNVFIKVWLCVCVCVFMYMPYKSSISSSQVIFTQ
jgi:hypothetical protein